LHRFRIAVHRYRAAAKRYGKIRKRYRKTRNWYDETSNRYGEIPKRYGAATKGLQIASEADADSSKGIRTMSDRFPVLLDANHFRAAEGPCFLGAPASLPALDPFTSPRPARVPALPGGSLLLASLFRLGLCLTSIRIRSIVESMY
jgi:hypothetical protein